MYQRLCNLSKTNSFFLFGPRGSGKTTLIKGFFREIPHLWIDLLIIGEELKYMRDPDLLLREFEALENRPQWIVIDEIQKVPKLLDVVHRMIEEKQVLFALTGSSARKLKRAQANLLAGRAFSFSLFSLSYQEIGDSFQLDEALNYGTLPQIFSHKLHNSKDKKRYLKSYISNYLKEEVVLEQLVRNLEPFYRFLEVAAQVNGEIINYSKIAREASITDRSVARYFEILSDTLMGHLIPAYHKSVRKQQIDSPRFYFFDIGIIRALRGDLKFALNPHTYDYGKIFESFIINEILKLNQYFETDYKIYYLKTKEGKEIDLILEDQKTTFLIEIKSKEITNKDHVDALCLLTPSFKNAKSYVFCLNQRPVQIDHNVIAIGWREGIDLLFKT